MNTRDDWPLPADVQENLYHWPLTPDELEAMREQYEREQIASAQSTMPDDDPSVDAAGTYTD
jgi:hypothetical protein